MSSLKAAAALLFASSVAMMGCTSEGEETESDDLHLEGAATAFAPAYAGLLRSTLQVRFADGTTQALTTTVRGFTTAEQSGSDLSLKLKACSFALPSVGGFAITMPEDTLQASVPEVVLRGHTATSGDRTTFETDETVVLLGLENVNATEPLPVDEKDPRVVDQDRDRSPGFSLRGGKFGVTGRIFVGLRAVASAKGQVAADGTIVATGVLRSDLTKDVQFYGDSLIGVDAAGMARDLVKGMTVIPGSEKYEVRLEPLRDGSFDSVAKKCAAVARALP